MMRDTSSIFHDFFSGGMFDIIINFDGVNSWDTVIVVSEVNIYGGSSVINLGNSTRNERSSSNSVFFTFFYNSFLSIFN